MFPFLKMTPMPEPGNRRFGDYCERFWDIAHNTVIGLLLFLTVWQILVWIMS